jgi:hypothetical protein
MMENIDDYLPRTLDDIVRRRRDEVQIRLATAMEIAALGEFLGDAQMTPGEAKDTISEWYPVTFRVRDDLHIRLLGRFERKGAISLTSQVLKLDLAADLAKTDNSLYRLGNPGEGEPPRHFVVLLCAILNDMGVGKTLGVPEVFF